MSTPQVAETPQQDNSVDCGVFSCTYANYLSRNLSLSFSAQDMDTFRRRITLDLLRARVDTDKHEVALVRWGQMVRRAPELIELRSSQRS